MRSPRVDWALGWGGLSLGQSGESIYYKYMWLLFYFFCDDMHTIATIVPHIDYLEPFTVVTCNNRPSHILPWAFHGSHSPSSGTGQSQDLSCTRFPCSLPELHISFVFDTLRFSVCIHIFGFVYFTNQPQDSYIFSFAACPKIPGRPPCPSCSVALSSSHHLFCIWYIEIYSPISSLFVLLSR